MSFVRKKQDIFGLTLNDSIWKNKEKRSLNLNDSNYSFTRMLNQNLIPENVSPVINKQEMKLERDNSCFQYGFPSLFELNNIYQPPDTEKEFGIINNNQKIINDRIINNQDYKFHQEDKKFYSLFQHDLLFNCPCCPPSLDPSKKSREIQQITDDDVSYVHQINEKYESRRKINSLKNVNNNNYYYSMSNKLKDERLNETNKFLLDNKNNKPSSGRSIPLDEKIEKSGNMTILKEKTVEPVNPYINNNNKSMNSKSQSSTLTVEKVQSILEFYHHSTSTIEKKRDDDKESFNDIDFFNISVNNIKFKCAQCDKDFFDKDSKEKHFRNDHKFICKICNKVSFHHKLQVQRHEEKVHGNYIKKKPRRCRTYFCCGQTFKTGREFGIHKSTHKFMNKRS